MGPQGFTWQGLGTLHVRTSTGKPKVMNISPSNLKSREVCRIRRRSRRTRMMHGVHQTPPVYINRDHAGLIEICTIYPILLFHLTRGENHNQNGFLSSDTRGFSSSYYKLCCLSFDPPPGSKHILYKLQRLDIQSLQQFSSQCDPPSHW